MKKEAFLLFFTVILTTVAALGIMRWFAPQFFGIPVNLRSVMVRQQRPPFFDGIFNEADFATDGSVLIEDPYILRGRSLYLYDGIWGPHDLLGFRNQNIPNITDIITIGDSQTYGNNVSLERNWPSRLAANLADRTNRLYNMAVGGWGAPEYLEIMAKAVHLRPRLVVVAFYTGNDPLDSFNQVYSKERFSDLRPDPRLTLDDAPAMVSIQSTADYWPVRFNDRIATVFTPKYRHASNMGHPAVRAGYEIMSTVAELLALKAAAHGIKVIFVIIPTKELIYAPKVARERVVPPRAYSDLVRDENDNYLNLAGQLQRIPGAVYADLLGGLQRAAMADVLLYPDNTNGHPVTEGYETIARLIAPTARKMLPGKPQGVVEIRYDDHPQLCLLRGDGVWYFKDFGVFFGNGWKYSQIGTIELRDLASRSFAGTIDIVDPARFGPASFAGFADESSR